MDNIFYRVLLRDDIKIEPKHLTRDYRQFILQKLRKQNEGVCTKHGYIRENSIELYKVAAGAVDKVGLNGYVVFDVHYYAEVCNPLLGNVVKAKVVNVNKFGILAEVAPILEIIVAKNSVNILSDNTIDLETIRPGDIIQVEIMGKKFELNDRKISIVGRVVSQPKPMSSPKPKVIPKDEEDEELDKFDLEDDTDESESDEEKETDDEEEEEEEDVDEIKGGSEQFFGSEEEEEEGDFELFDEEQDFNGDDDSSDASDDDA